jgi:hypothetical protein
MKSNNNRHNDKGVGTGQRWSGCWEVREGREICRYMIAWQTLAHGLYGCLGGYSGGGAFQLEKFWSSGSDVILDLDVSISDWKSDGIVAAEACQDVVLAYHDEARWIDWDTLLLLPAKRNELEQHDDLLVGGEPVPAELMGVFSKVGLITKP